MLVTRHAVVICLSASLMTLAVGCAAGSTSSSSSEGESQDTTQAVVTLPSRESFAPSVRTRLTGYHLVIKAMAGGCGTAGETDQTQLWSVSAITTQIRQGCDYSIGMELGEKTGTATRLSEVFYTNLDANGIGRILRASQFANMPAVNLKLELGITDAGRRAGFGNEGVVVGSNTDLSINVSVDAGAPTPRPATCQSGDFSEGSLMDSDEANRVCPTWCSHKNAVWNKQWTSRGDGTSVCGCVCQQPSVPDAGPECKNTNSQCADWAALGECKKNPDYMLTNCCVSCNTREQPAAPSTPTPPTNPASPSIECTRDVPPPTATEFTCAQQAGWGKCKETWMANYCNIACGRCPKN